MKINCVVIDDEPVSREIIQNYIDNCPYLNLVSVYSNAIEAIEIINRKEISLIFLDINMPRLSGINFYKSLNNPPLVIFTTAYPEYAIDGFDLNAVDYLLKPFSFERFLKAVNKANSIIQSRSFKNENEFILLKSDKKLYKIKIENILHLEAIGDYVKVNYENTNILVHETFQGMLDQLPTDLFARIHKSHAISLKHFQIIEANMVVINGKSLPIGQTYKKDFLSRITQWIQKDTK